MEGLPDPVSEPIPESDPGSSEHFRFAIDLYNYGYYWESHVYFEALWNAHKRQGPVADLLKALIKLGAGGVKLSLKENQNAEEHFERAKELLSDVKKHKGADFLGLNLNELLEQINSGKEIKIVPAWS